MSDADDSGSARQHPGDAPPPAAGPAPGSETHTEPAQGTEPPPPAPTGYSWPSGDTADAPGWATSPPPFDEAPVDEAPAGEKPRRTWPIRRADLIWALTWAAISAALGIPLAFLWVALGPHVDFVMTAPGRPDLADYNTEAFVAGDGRFALLTAIAGALAGAIAWLLRRGRGPLVVVGLALGSLASAWIARKLGTMQGEDQFQHLLRAAHAGQHFGQNMRLRATGLLYLQALTAVAVYVGCAAWSRYPDLSPTGLYAGLHGEPEDPHPAYAGSPGQPSGAGPQSRGPG